MNHVHAYCDDLANHVALAGKLSIAIVRIVTQRETANSHEAETLCATPDGAAAPTHQKTSIHLSNGVASNT